MITLLDYINGIPKDNIKKDDYVLTNCLVIKKHIDIVVNDLLPTWISQKYMYDVDENLNMPPLLEMKARGDVEDVYIDGFDRVWGRVWK
jgi:hypothetical protein